MLSEFCPGSVKGTKCSQGPLCCWLSEDGRGVTGREGGEPVLLPTSSSLHPVHQSCLLRCKNVCIITKLPSLHEQHLHHMSHSRT